MIYRLHQFQTAQNAYTSCPTCVIVSRLWPYYSPSPHTGPVLLHLRSRVNAHLLHGFWSRAAISSLPLPPAASHGSGQSQRGESSRAPQLSPADVPLTPLVIPCLSDTHPTPLMTPLRHTPYPSCDTLPLRHTPYPSYDTLPLRHTPYPSYDTSQTHTLPLL